MRARSEREGVMSTDNGHENKWMILLTVAVNGFLNILDISIVNISFPTLTIVFETEPSVIVWVSLAYALVTVGLMLILGRIGDLYGRKKIFLLGYVLFTIGLIFCSVSQSIIHLILSRVIQGIGGAMNMALSLAIVTDAFPARERGKAIGLASSVFAVGPLLGFTMGGFLLEAFGWRSLFYTRVPICIIGIIMAWKLLRDDKTSSTDTRLDLLGTATIFISLSCLLLFLNLGGMKGFSSVPILTLGLLAVILFLLFILQEKRIDHPVVDLGLFKNSAFAGGSLTLIIFGLAQSSHFFLMPFYFISGVGYSSSTAGLFMAIPPLLFASITPLSGWLSDKLGPKPLCTAGMIFQCLGLYICSRFTIESSPSEIIPGLALFAIGGSLFFTPNSSLLIGASPKDHLGTVGALINTIRQVGMTSGVAVAGMILTIRQAFHADQLANKNLEPTILSQLSITGGFKDAILIAAIVSFFGILTSALIGSKK